MRTMTGAGRRAGWGSVVLLAAAVASGQAWAGPDGGPGSGTGAGTGTGTADAGVAGAVDSGIAAPSLLAPDPDAPTLTTRLEKSKVAFGEPAILVLGVIHRRGVDITLPTAPELGPFMVLGTEEKKIDLADGNVKHEFRLKLVPLDVGRLVVPPVEVVYRNTAGQYRTMRSDDLPVDVVSAIANEPEPKLRDDTKPVVVYEDDYTLLWIGSGILAVIAIAGLTLLIARSIRRKAAMRRPAAPPRPADVVALERLAKLRAEWRAAGSAKDYQLYYLELSEILRGYLGGRWGFDSLELTTTELTEVMKRHLADEELRLRLQAWLEDTDLVKFANLTPEEDEAERAWDDANAFVIVTKPVIVVEAATAAGASGSASAGGPGTGTGTGTGAGTGASASASASAAGGAA